MRSEGIFHNNPDEALIDRFPLLPVAEIRRLTALAAALVADATQEEIES